MTRQANHAHVMAEVLAAKLRANAEFLAHFQNLLFHLQVAEGPAVVIALGGQGIEVPRTGEFGCFEGVFRRRAPYYQREVIGRAGRCAEFAQALVDKIAQPIRREQGAGFLKEQTLVGGPAAFCHDHELVLIPLIRIDLDLRGQIGLGIRLLKHIERRHLAVAQIRFPKRLGNAVRERGLVATICPHAMALFAHHNDRARVLTHGQDPPGRDVGVFEHFNGDEPVVVRGFGVVENFAQLLQMRGPQQMRAVSNRTVRQHGQSLGFDFENLPTLKRAGGNPIGR